jgi:hypothetical protein
MIIELDIIKYNGQWVLLVNDYDIQIAVDTSYKRSYTLENFDPFFNETLLFNVKVGIKWSTPPSWIQ